MRNRQSPVKDYEYFGVGIVLYLQFLKRLALLFLLYTLLQAPFAVINNYNYLLMLEDYSQYQIQDYLTGSTLFPFASSRQQCGSLSPDSSARIDLTCKTGHIGSKFLFGILQQPSKQSCYFQDRREVFAGCNLLDDPQFRQACTGKPSCTLPLSLIFRAREDCPALANNLEVFFQLSCEAQIVHLLSEDRSIPLEYYLQAQNIVDALMMLVFIFLLLFEQGWNVHDEEILESDKLKVQKYCFQISNLPEMDPRELQVKLRTYLEERLAQNWSTSGLRNYGVPYPIIYSLKVAEPLGYLDIDERKNRAIYKHQVRVYQFFQKYLHNQGPPLLKPGVLQEQDVLRHIRQLRLERSALRLTSCSGLCDWIRKTLRIRRLQSYLRLFDLQQQRITEIKNQKQVSKQGQEKTEIKYAYVLVNQQSLAYLARWSLTGKASRLQMFFHWCSCCVLRKKYFEGKYLFYEQAPRPENINWRNIYYTTFQKKFRRALSLLLTLFFVAGCSAVIVTLQSIMLDQQKIYPQVNCYQSRFLNISKAQILLD